MPRKAGGARRKRRTHVKPLSSESQGTASAPPPRSFVLRRGSVPNGVRDLIIDLRQMLMPHTAAHLRERKSNNIRDYVSVATQLGVSHFWLLSATDRAPYLRLAKVPQGPTLTFRIAEYTLSSHVRATQRRPLVLQDHDLDEPPLLVLNNFATTAGAKHESAVKLVAETFRHSFPPLDVHAAKLSSLRRVLLVNRDLESGLLYLRHYALKVQPAGLSRPVRKLVTKRRVPKLNKLADVAQLIDGSAPPGVFSSDSEAEDTSGYARVTLAQPVKALRKGASSKIKLVEVGPRLTLELVKVQAGLCDGAVLYHNFVTKSAAEADEDQKRVDAKKLLKRKRREEQEVNVDRKRNLKRAKKERHKKNVEARLAAEQEAKDRDAGNGDGNGEEVNNNRLVGNALGDEEGDASGEESAHYESEGASSDRADSD